MSPTQRIDPETRQAPDEPRAWIACCAGLDVHKDSVEVCVREVEAEPKLRHRIRRWATTTQELMATAEWLNRLRKNSMF